MSENACPNVARPKVARPKVARPHSSARGVPLSVTPIRLFGDPVLRTPADPVVDFDKELRALVADLTDTLLDAAGAGLAAPQIGVGLRVFVFDVEDVVRHLINPVLSFPDDEEQDGQEGCLSIPGLYYDTKRRQNVVAKG